jgi:hypothetical protein
MCAGTALEIVTEMSAKFFGRGEPICNAVPSIRSFGQWLPRVCCEAVITQARWALRQNLVIEPLAHESFLASP